MTYQDMNASSPVASSGGEAHYPYIPSPRAIGTCSLPVLIGSARVLLVHKYLHTCHETCGVWLSPSRRKRSCGALAVGCLSSARCSACLCIGKSIKSQVKQCKFESRGHLYKSQRVGSIHESRHAAPDYRLSRTRVN